MSEKTSENTIEKLHESLLIILDEVDRICRKNNIPYFLDSGTALGAIRHKGFIPWDDDADIGMLRADYERFLSIAARELDSKFFLQTYETDPGYLKFNAKIRMNGTRFPETLNRGKQLHQGIFIDIFPFDFTSDKETAARKETNKIRRIYRLWMIRQNRSINDNAARKLIRHVAKILPKDMLRNQYRSVYTKYDQTNTLTCYAYKMNDNHYLYFNHADFQNRIDVDFEGHRYMLMQGYDNYLKTMFGDYMVLPPAEKRVAHFEGEIVFENA